MGLQFRIEANRRLVRCLVSAGGSCSVVRTGSDAEGCGWWLIEWGVNLCLCYPQLKPWLRHRQVQAGKLPCNQVALKTSVDDRQFLVELVCGLVGNRLILLQDQHHA